MIMGLRSMPLLLVAALLPASSSADVEKAFYDRVEFAVTATASVASDLLVAHLSSQMEGTNSAEMADQVNKTITQAVKRIKQSQDVRVETTAYQTAPIYQDERLVGWRVRQSIRLESANIIRLSNLLGELQESLNLDGISYDVTQETLRRVEESMTEQVLGQFQQRADKIARGLGRSRYRMVSVKISNPNLPVPAVMMAARPVGSAEGGSAPTLEPNERKIQITVTGTIELQTE